MPRPPPTQSEARPVRTFLFSISCKSNSGKALRLTEFFLIFPKIRQIPAMSRAPDQHRNADAAADTE